jgi:hypothetical protein
LNSIVSGREGSELDLPLCTLHGDIRNEVSELENVVLGKSGSSAASLQSIQGFRDEGELCE